MEDIVKIILETPNDNELGALVRNLYNSSPESFNAADRYVRLVAEFENYKKRTNNERVEIKNRALISVSEPLLNMSDELSFGIKNSKDNNDTGLVVIYNKLVKELESIGITFVQTKTYDPEIHEVVAEAGEGKTIIDVINHGFMIGGIIYRYPKVILG